MIVEGKIETEINEDIEKEIYECFSLFDTSKSGYIDIREFYFALRSLGEHIEESELKRMIDYADKNNDKSIDKSEFKNLILSIWKNALLSDLDSDYE
ncbi:centrin-4, putative [Plasmodium vinckei lentum]|uniref:non-specific serine/threonine protein kinase n=1 Tax=Plasmodium vinckei lentum TaxID=138297 RepID=A0A6V7S3C4_PLAVN|nr:centrin-4, putative [Plasmodium vinckei lentum]